MTRQKTIKSFIAMIFLVLSSVGAETRDLRTLVVAVDQHLPPRSLAAILDVTAPKSVTVESGSALEDLLPNLYPGYSADYRAVIRKHIESRNRLSFELLRRTAENPWAAPLPIELTLSVPVAPPRQKPVVVDVFEDLRVDEVMARYSPEIGPKAREEIIRANREALKRRLLRPSRGLWALKGSKLEIPPTSFVFSAEIRPGADTAALAGEPGIEAFELDDVPSSGFWASPDCPGDVGHDWYAESIGLNRLDPDEILALGPQPVGIAVLDTGVDTSHEAIQEVLGLSFDEDQEGPSVEDSHGHGTHVAGLATGRVSYSAESFARHRRALAEKLRLLSYKVTRGVPHDSVPHAGYAANAVYRAKSRGARVVNLSLYAKDSEVLAAQMEEGSEGVLFVTAAGNADCPRCSNLCEARSINLDDAPDRYFPAEWDLANQIIVAATTNDGSLAPTSFHGRDGAVEIAAPGVKISGPESGGDYVFKNGTSQATPLVSLAAGLVHARGELSAREEGGGYCGADVKKRLLETCDLRDGLSSSVANGCHLNLAKAFYADLDVIELNGDDRYLRGTIVGRPQVLDSDGELEGLPSAFRRVWFGDPSEGSGDVVPTGRRRDGHRWSRGFARTGKIRDFEVRTDDWIRMETVDDYCPGERPEPGHCSVRLSEVRDIVFALNPRKRCVGSFR